MTASTGADGSARRNGSADTSAAAGASAIADASAFGRPWASVSGDAALSEEDHATIEENLRLASGGAAPALSWQTLRELAASAAGGAELAEGEGGTEGRPSADAAARVFAAVESAMALAPRDPLEGMLVAQMAAVHAAAMRCLVRAGECADYPQIEALYLRLAARLLNLFVRQAEALDRRARRFRGPGRDDSAAEASSRYAGGAGGTGAIEGGDEGLAILARLVAACRTDMEAHRRE